MKIRKYQVGSIIYTPTPTGAATASTQATASTSSSTASDKPEKITGTILKEMMDLMETDGLPSDVDELLQYASKYLDKSSHLTDMSLFGGSDNDYDIKDYIRILRLVQKTKFNKSEYEKASSNLEKEGAWGNAATDTNGKMWVQTEDGIGKVTVNEYVKNRDKYAVITNGQLMDYRARYPQFAFDSMGMLTNLQEVDGMKSISDQLRAIVKDFKQKKVEYYKFSKGSDKITDKSGRSYNMQELSDGMEMLTQGGPSGYYKITKSTNMPDMSAAVGYLWNSLDQSMKNTIKAQIAANGGDADSKDIASFLGEVLSAGLETTNSADFDSSATNYDPNGTQKKGGSADKGDALTQMNYLGQIAAGYFGPSKQINIIGKTSKVEKAGMLETQGWDLGAVIGHDHQTLKKQTVSSLLSNAWGLQAADTSSITFGNRHISAEEAQALYWNGADHLQAVQLPVTRDDNGNIIPDFELNQKIQELNKAVKGKSPTEVNDYIQANFPGIEVKKNEKGDYEAVNVPTMTFLTLKATVSDDLLKLTDENKLMLDHVTGDARDLLKTVYDRIIKYGDITPNKNVGSSGFGKAGKNSFYTGNVYIPIDDTYSGFRVSGLDPYVTKDTLSNPAEKAALRQMVSARAQSGPDIITNFTK